MTARGMRSDDGHWRERVPKWARPAITLLLILTFPLWLVPAGIAFLVWIIYGAIWHPDECQD